MSYSALDCHKDRIVNWLEHNKSGSYIADELAKLGVVVGNSYINKYIKTLGVDRGKIEHNHVKVPFIECKGKHEAGRSGTTFHGGVTILG